MKKPELLAPAGNIDALKQAIHHGADAIYLGGTHFGARAFANNFSNPEIKAAIAYAHLYGKKIYITANTLIYQQNVDAFLNYIDFLNDAGADAVILQDIGMTSLIKSKYPDLPIHASTQMHNHSYSAVAFAKTLGVQRVVVAREMSTSEIANLQNLDIETEVFIHGALCIAYSGQCLFSALTKGRSGNQGTCAQNCRMRYTLNQQQEGKLVQIQTQGEFLLSPKDLGTLGYIKTLMDIGITSFKIEGRMKSAEYVGFVTSLYRRLIDDYLEHGKSDISKMDMDSLNRLFNRGFTGGLLQDEFGSAMMSKKRPNHAGVSAGNVTKATKSKITIKVTNPINQGDGIKFDKADTGMIAEKIYQNGLLVSGAKQGDLIELDNKVHLTAPDTLLITNDKKLNDRLRLYYEIKVPIDLHVSARLGTPLCVTLTDKVHTVTKTDGIIALAKNNPTNTETIKEQLGRLGNTAFKLNGFTCTCDENVFVPKSTLNQVRRVLTDQLSTLRQKPIVRKTATVNIKALYALQKPVLAKAGYSVFVRNNAQLNAALQYPFVRIYTDHTQLYNQQKAAINTLFYAPARAGKNCINPDNLLATETGALADLSAKNIVCDYSLNALNIYTFAKLYALGAQVVTLSPELKINDIMTLLNTYTHCFGTMPHVEKIIYGRFELMLIKNRIIASALTKPTHAGLCHANDYYLKDINHNVYPIKTDENGNNRIFEANNNDEISTISRYKKMGIASFRLMLLEETKDECHLLFKRLTF